MAGCFNGKKQFDSVKVQKKYPAPVEVQGISNNVFKRLRNCLSLSNKYN